MESIHVSTLVAIEYIFFKLHSEFSMFCSIFIVKNSYVWWAGIKHFKEIDVTSVLQREYRYFEIIIRLFYANNLSVFSHIIKW